MDYNTIYYPNDKYEAVGDDLIVLYENTYSNVDLDNYDVALNKIFNLSGIIQYHDHNIDDINDVIDVTLSQEVYDYDNYSLYVYSTDKFKLGYVVSFDYQGYLKVAQYEGNLRSIDWINYDTSLELDFVVGVWYDAVGALLISQKSTKPISPILLNSPNVQLGELNTRDSLSYRTIRYYLPSETWSKENVVNSLKFFPEQFIKYRDGVLVSPNSLTQLVIAILKDEISVDCTSLAVIPSHTSIPEDIEVSSLSKIKDCLIVSILGLDISIISNYEDGVIDKDNHFSVLKSNSGVTLITIWDNFENEVMGSESVITCQVGDKTFELSDSLETSYVSKVIEWKDKSLLGNKIIVYSFGDRVFPLLRDLASEDVKVDSLYVEGVSCPTRGFTSYEDIFGIQDIKIYNLWQDYIVNNKYKFGLWDDILITDIFDIVIEKLEWVDCLHHPSMYSFVLSGIQ